MNGVIFDIKEGAIHDGPGIRQTVFLKGCPLRCSWCHNPEGLLVRRQLMVSPNGCKRCGKCKAVCPAWKDADGFGVREGCTACGACVRACPERIRKIAGEVLSSDALAERLMRNADYYRRVGGGVTFSGGEPLLQAAFVLETLAKLPETVHKAVETSGEGEESAFADFIRAFDLVMMDLKCMDDERHKKFTGVSNARILRNARALCEGDTPFVIRIPVIPGVNDDGAHFKAVAAFVAGAPKLLRVELLPYHMTAGAKYAMLGRAYAPGFDAEQPIRIDQRVFEQYGIRSTVL